MSQSTNVPEPTGPADQQPAGGPAMPPRPGWHRWRWLSVAAAAVVLVAAGTTIAYAATSDHTTTAGSAAGTSASAMGDSAAAPAATSATSATAGHPMSPGHPAKKTRKNTRKAGKDVGHRAPAGTVVNGVNISGFPTDQRAGGIFTDRCAYSHSAADDPILAPGKPGQAMHHDFYGNTGTSASSTAASLVGGSTTCTTTADSSAYWTPVLFQNGKALTPSSALIYWRQSAALAPSVRTIPVGLQMIAGDEAATAPQSTSVVRWTCSATKAHPFPAKGTATPHDCSGSARLRLVVTFPSCWDGHTLSAVGQTNVVYPVDGSCPASHPVAIPQIVFHVVYPTSSAANLTLSMTPTMTGSTDTEHVDFVNGWKQSVLEANVAACVATATRCGPVTGPSATPHGPSIATLATEKARQILQDRARARRSGGH